jgi:ankyrin repeat protein
VGVDVSDRVNLDLGLLFPAASYCPTFVQSGFTALIMAVRFGRADCARLLLDSGADKNAKSNVCL